ncbi:MAG: MmgE/PrpD family protein [Hyphomicrobiaceae bacterium]
MQQPSSGATDAIAEFVLVTKAQAIPEMVRHEAKRSLLNIIGCTIGGARHAAVETLWRGVGPFSGAPLVTLLGRATRTDAVTAALVNTFASSINTFDDTHAEAIIHPSGPIMGTVLAVAELRPVTGAALLDAFALGVEVACRWSKAVSVAPAKGIIAWSQTGICSGVAAAAAAARLLGLDAATTRRAIGIAASQASGIRAMHGSMCTAMMPAQAGQTGLRAALLAEAGFTAGENAFEGRYGFAECFSTAAHVAHLTAGLGTHWEILGNTYKPFPCGIVINPLIDAALQMRQQHGLTGDMIDNVAANCSPGALALCDRPNPKDELEAQVSLYHWLAAAFVKGRASVPEGTDAAVRDPAMAAFRARIKATPDATIPIDGCDLVVTLTDGRVLKHAVRDCIGSRGRPMTDRELEAKFMGLAEGISPKERIARLIADCWQCETLPRGATLAELAA